MKQVPVTICLYSINELQGKAKERAINEHFNFMSNEPIEYENEAGEMVSEYYEPNISEVIENIEMNGYLYFEDGIMAKTILYCGKHEKAGLHEFEFLGNTYVIN